MNKLDVGVNAYMDEQNKKSGEIEEPLQTTTDAAHSGEGKS